jgi:hypothetical protein
VATHQIRGRGHGFGFGYHNPPPRIKKIRAEGNTVVSRLEFRNIIYVLFTDGGTFKATNTKKPKLILAELAHGVAQDL